MWLLRSRPPRCRPPRCTPSHSRLFRLWLHRPLRPPRARPPRCWPRSAGRGASRERADLARSIAAMYLHRSDASQWKTAAASRNYAKRSRQSRDESVHEHPRPCKKCRAWCVCRTAPENKARGAKHGHCSNPNCVRSFGRVHGQDVPVRDRPTQPDCLIIDDGGQQGLPAGPKAPPAAF